jgi:hypothetical protein
MIAHIALLALVVAAPMAVAARHDSPQQPPLSCRGKPALFTQHPRRSVLGSSRAASCINQPSGLHTSAVSSIVP